jgi:multidrug efflux pump subunit AcrB
MGDVEDDIKSRVEEMNLPAGYSVSFTGESEDMAESFDYTLNKRVWISTPATTISGDDI